MNNKYIIYQLLPRLFTNSNSTCIHNGTIEQNSVGKMNDITENVLKSIKDLGATHVWYTGVIEHATKTDYTEFGIDKDNAHIVKGNAGSPYAIKDYYDIDPDIAVNVDKRMQEFEQLVKRTHKSKLKVIVDFVPNHVARQYHSDSKPEGIEDLGANDNRDYGFEPNNNFYYIPRQLFSAQIDLGQGDDSYFEFPAKATGNDCFSAFPNVNDWYETVKINYGVDYGNNTKHFNPIPNTWFKMLNILRFWASKNIDGFRCDMAHMVPVEFWEWAIPQVKEKYPDIIFIAEIYDVALYRDYINKGGFDYLYDKVTLYDSLKAIQCAGKSAAQLTGCWQTVDGIGDHMLSFLENHDEQRVASRFFMGDPFKAIPSLVVSTTINKGPFLIYSGQELGEPAAVSEGFSGDDGRTTIFDYWSVPSIRRWFNEGKCDEQKLTKSEILLRDTYKKILNLSTSEKAITNGDFFDLMYVNYDNKDFNPHHLYTYLRHYKTETLLFVINFSGTKQSAKINIPQHAFDTLKIKQGEYKGTDLLENKTTEVLFSATHPVETEVAPYSAKIIKLKKVK